MGFEAISYNEDTHEETDEINENEVESIQPDVDAETSTLKVSADEISELSSVGESAGEEKL